MYYETIKKLPIYKGLWGIIISDNRDKIEKKRDITFNEEPYAHVYLLSINRGKKNARCVMFIFNPNNEYAKLTHAQITHECIHAVNMVFELDEITHDVVNDEPAAYLGEYFTKYIYKFFKKQKIKIR